MEGGADSPHPYPSLLHALLAFGLEKNPVKIYEIIERSILRIPPTHTSLGPRFPLHERDTPSHVEHRSFGLNTLSPAYKYSCTTTMKLPF